MDHLLLRNLLLAAVCFVSGIGCFFLMRYAYKTCKSQTPFEKRVRRVVVYYFPLVLFWQGCLALRLPILHAFWIQVAGYGFIILWMTTGLLFLFVQNKRTEASRDKALTL